MAAIAPGDEVRTGALVIPNPMTHPTLDVPQVAPLLRMSTWAVYESIKRGDFPVAVVRVGRAIRIPTRPLLDLLGLS